MMKRGEEGKKSETAGNWNQKLTPFIHPQVYPQFILRHSFSVMVSEYALRTASDRALLGIIPVCWNHYLFHIRTTSMLAATFIPPSEAVV